MQKLSELEQRILDKAIRFQTSKPAQAQSAEKKFEYWYQLAHSHLLRVTMPKLTNSLVGVWLTSFLWGASSVHKRSTFDDRTYLYREGTFGTGYTVVTLDSLYTVSLKELTARYPRFDTGFMGQFFSALGGEIRAATTIEARRSGRNST